MKEISLIAVRIVVAKDIQEKMGFKDDSTIYDLKADFDEVYEETVEEMSKKELIVCYNKIMNGEDNERS